MIDCQEVTFMDSAGLSALVEAQRGATLEFGTVTLRNPSELIVRLLEITGLADGLLTENGYEPRGD